MQGQLEPTRPNRLSRPLRAVIVDDEKPARRDLISLLAAHPEIEVVGEANNLENAVKVINKLKPDVVFLDIQLPGSSGFELLEKVEVNFKVIKVIFVTAYDEYAVRAFEVNASDYLLKPIQPERLATAIRRLLNDEIRFVAESLAEAEAETKAEAEAENEKKYEYEYEDRFLLKLGDSVRVLKISAIKGIFAEGNYSAVLTADDKKALVLMPLKEWEERLPKQHFVRIHRSTIINLEYLERLEKWFNYSYRLYLRQVKEPLAVSRRDVAKLKQKLK